MRRCFLLIFSLIAALVFSFRPAAAARPNIVYILADDLGYGDVGAFNPAGKIPTPQLDRLASDGMVFTDAHSGSAVCTPTRYGILTGRYCWRSRLKRGVLMGYGQRLIEPERLTVAQFLSDRGYATACVGKWHLGMNWPLKDGDGFAESEQDGWDVDYAAPIEDGPLALGFDEFFGISASLDMPPYVFIDGDRAAEIPTTEKKWIRQGPAGEDFEAIDVMPRLTERAVDFIRRSASAARDDQKPFFLYLPLAAPHTPIVPTEPWQGKSGLNDYGDFVMQVDAAVGKVIAALDDENLADHTLVIFTSDNGCSPQADFKTLRAKGHDPSANLRGHKADIFEGGHRVPFIARWVGRVAAGSKVDGPVCLTDLFATCADILGDDVPPDAAEDSVSMLPALDGADHATGRDSVVHHSINGSFAIRSGAWKLILCPGSGGWSDPRPKAAAEADLPDAQLYRLSDDLSESRNLEVERPDKVEELTALLQGQVDRGRSTPGPPQPNTEPVSIRP